MLELEEKINIIEAVEAIEEEKKVKKRDLFGSTVLAVHHLQGWRRAC